MGRNHQSEVQVQSDVDIGQYAYDQDKAMKCSYFTVQGQAAFVRYYVQNLPYLMKHATIDDSRPFPGICVLLIYVSIPNMAARLSHPAC